MNPQTQNPKDNKHNNGTHASKPETKVETKTETKAETKPAEQKAGEAAAETEVKRDPAKVYLVTGSIMEFKNAAEAEKYLNDAPEAPKDFTCIKGKKIEKKQKVSLR